MPEPQLEGGDGERERRMACGVVFCLLSVRAVPSVKKKREDHTRVVCHVEKIPQQTPSVNFRTSRGTAADWHSDALCSGLADTSERRACINQRKGKVEQCET